MQPAMIGGIAALGAFVIWGLAPLYFKAVAFATPSEIVAHRILWTVIVVGGLIMIRRSRSQMTAALTPLRLAYYVATTLLISVNWLIFISAVNSGHMVECSLGYYINPLVNVLLGMLFLNERLSRRGGLAVVIAAAGVGVLIAGHDGVPWISLNLAVTFGFYALLRKKGDIDPLIGLFMETALVAPPALIYLLWADSRGLVAFGHGGLTRDIALAAAGVITAVPLILFMSAARRLQLSTLGLMQYMTPTCHLMLATLIYNEPFTMTHAITFTCIWGALGLYSLDLLAAHRRLAQGLEPVPKVYP